MTRPLRIVQPNVRLVDPHDCTDAADALSILMALFDTLLRRDGLQIVPQLAESWTVSEGCRQVDISLRADARFSDGTPVDAQAVCANLRRMARPDKGYTLGSPGVWRQYLGGADIRPTSGHSLRIGLAEPVADLPDILCQAFIAAPGCFAHLDAGDMAASIGSGPYRLDHVAEGSVRVSAVQGHFAGAPPHATIEWMADPDAQSRWVRLAEGQADMAMRLPPGRPPPGGATHRGHTDPTAIIYLFNQSAGPLRDGRLRRALNLAVDRTALIEDVLGGGAKPLHGFVSDAHYGSVVGTGDPHDPDEARRLLDAAGQGAGLRLSVDCPTRLPDEAEALTACLAQQLAPFGITLDVRRHEDREAYAHMVRRKEIGDMCVFDSSPLSTFRVVYEKLDSRVAGAWWQGHRSPALERYLDIARRTADPAAREAIYQDIYRDAQADPPWLYLYTTTRIIGLREAVPDFAMPTDGVLDVARLPAFDRAASRA